jgi:uncharacterized membrane protein
MSPHFELFKLIHVVGFVLWLGSAFGIIGLLYAHAGAPREHWPSFLPSERLSARVMDVGAALALFGGIGMLLATRSLGDAWPLKQGWLHAKFLLLVCLLGLHGFLRVKAGRFRREQVKPLGMWPYYLLALLALAIIVFAVLRPF